MTKRLITLLAALLVLGFVVAGCGDDESDSAGNGDTTAAETATDTAAGDETVTGDVTETDTETDTVTEKEPDTAKGGGAAAPTAPAQTKENCERGMRSAKQLDEDVREKLVGLCDKATSDDPDDRREAAQEFCRTMVDSLYDDGRDGRDQALESCDKAGGQPAGEQ